MFRNQALNNTQLSEMTGQVIGRVRVGVSRSLSQRCFFETSRFLILVPWLRQGMHCSRGSGSHRNEGRERILMGSAGRACNSVGSKAEPWNQLAAIGEKCRFFRVILIIILSIASVSQSGCSTLSLPAIDPTGNRIFAGGPNAFTRIISPHDPNNGYPSQQPAFQTPPSPPPCMQGIDGREKKLCLGCLTGKGCLAKKREAEEVRGRCGQLLLTPTRIVAPVGGEVILLAGVCGKDEYLVTNEPIEWMLSPGSVGTFVEVGDDSKGQRRSVWKKDVGPKVEKLGVDFARGRTSREAGNISRGTSTKSDDLPIRKGQTWISITSPTEGISKVTALAPDSDVWDQRRQTATIYWVEDASWKFPQPQPALSGDTVRLVTSVVKADGYIPAEGWLVRYRVLNPELAKFLPSGAETAQIEVNSDGVATVDIALGEQVEGKVPHGTAMVEIEVIRPKRGDIPELPLGRGVTQVTWSAAELLLTVGGPEIAVPGQSLNYFATLVNSGDLNAENVIVRAVVPQGMALTSSSIQPSNATNGAYAWELGPLQPRRAFDLNFNLTPQAEMDAQIVIEAVGTNLRQQKSVRTSVQRPQVTLQIAPKQNANQIEVGGEAVFEILVTNSGTQTLNDVRIKLQSDPGLQHSQDNANEVTNVIGFLAPGQSRKLDGVFRVAKEGDLTIKATVESIGQVIATQTAFIRGLPATPKRPSLSLEVKSDLLQPVVPVGGEFTFTWFVNNTGPMTLRNPVVSMQHSPNLEVSALSQGVDYKVENQVGKWLRLPDLPPGGRLELSGRFKGIAPGNQSSVVVMVEAERIEDRKTFFLNVGNSGATGDVMPNNNQTNNSGAFNKPAISPNNQTSQRLGVTIQPVSNSIFKGDVGTYEIRIENLVNKPDQRVSLTLLTPEGTVLKSIRAKDLQYKLTNGDRQLDLEPIKYFRPNDSFSCVLQLRHDQVEVGELVASVTSLGQTTPVTKSLRIQVLSR